jgi:hypothetical protein
MYYYYLALPVNNRNNNNSGVCCCKIITFAHIFLLVKESEDTVQKTVLVIYVCTHLCMCMYLYLCVGEEGNGASERQNNSPTIQPHMKSIWIDKASMVRTLDYESVIQ